MIGNLISVCWLLGLFSIHVTAVKMLHTYCTLVIVMLFLLPVLTSTYIQTNFREKKLKGGISAHKKNSTECAEGLFNLFQILL